MQNIEEVTISKFDVYENAVQRLILHGTPSLSPAPQLRSLHQSTQLLGFCKFVRQTTGSSPLGAGVRGLHP